MMPKKIPHVSLVAGKEQKYVCFQLILPDQKEALTLWGDPKATYHSDIVDKVWKRIRNRVHDCTVKGGGRILIRTKEKVIFVWGHSLEYGPANLDRVAEVLHTAYPDYEIRLETEPD